MWVSGKKTLKNFSPAKLVHIALQIFNILPCLPYSLHISNPCWWLVLTASLSRVWIFFALLRFSFDSPLYFPHQMARGWRCKRCCHRQFKCHGDEMLVLILFDSSCTAWQWADTSIFSLEVGRKSKSVWYICEQSLWPMGTAEEAISVHSSYCPSPHIVSAPHPMGLTDSVLTSPALLPFPLTGTWKALVPTECWQIRLRA